MSNTLTNLIPMLYTAADRVSRELTGFIPAVTLNSEAAAAAVGQTVTYPITGAAVIGNVTAAATGPDPADQTDGNDSMTITKSRSGTFYYTGEEQLGLGGLYDRLITDKFTQQMRALTNEIEADLAALQAYASRGYAAHATTPVVPFASDLSESAQVLKILKDNGCGSSDLQLVINTTAGAKLRTLGQLTKVSEAGSDGILRQGVLLDMHGFAIRESAKIVSTTAVGNNTGTYAANGAHAVGATTITVKTGSGTILAGDVITFSSDTTLKYVVKTGVNNGTTIVLNAPGLMKALAGDETVAIVGTCARNVAFDRSAIHLLTRTPAMPAGGDSADDVMNITDPQSGLVFQVAMYRQRRRIAYEVGIAWGVKAAKEADIALLLGQ